MPSTVHYEELGGDTVDIRNALRLGDRFRINDEGSFHDENNGAANREVSIDAEGARKVIINVEEISASGDSVYIQVNGRSNGYNNYYKSGSPDENASSVTLAKNVSSNRPWVGNIEIHSRQTLSFVANGARAGNPQNTLDYATWQSQYNNPGNADIDSIMFMARGGGSELRMKRAQIFSIYTKTRDHNNPGEW